jgi:hypothetical protein
MHPLVEDFSKLTDSELQERINKISNVLRQTGNGSLVDQALMIRTVLLEEQERRYRELLEKSIKNNKMSDSIDIS